MRKLRLKKVTGPVLHQYVGKPQFKANVNKYRSYTISCCTILPVAPCLCVSVSSSVAWDDNSYLTGLGCGLRGVT